MCTAFLHNRSNSTIKKKKLILCVRGMPDTSVLGGGQSETETEFWRARGLSEPPGHKHVVLGPLAYVAPFSCL